MNMKAQIETKPIGHQNRSTKPRETPYKGLRRNFFENFALYLFIY